MKIAEKIITSSGVKRQISSAISFITGIAVALSEFVIGIPGISSIFNLGSISAGSLGTAGVVHAAKAGTLSVNKSGTVASVFAAIAMVAQYIPILQPYTLIFQAIATTFGAVGMFPKDSSDN